mmetsp:Transcript_60736/g.144652  ORF Transcript_60736/g.144652 Transcript_60736/m.144652 type:complete len:826 (-) Transcript_60736:167-2644(-)
MDSSPPQALAPHTGSSSGNVVSKRATSRDQDGGKVEQRSSFLNFGRIHSEESQGIFPRLVSFDPTASRQSQGTTGHTTASHEVHPEKKGAVFVDAESMKAKVRQNLQKRQHNVKEYYKDSGVWQSIARSQKFEVITLGVIALNSLWIAVDTDLNDAEILLNAHPVFQVAEHFFCAFFFFEWLTRYMAFKRKRDCLKDAWFLFDSGLVFMMVSETWIMTGITLLTGAGAGGGAGNTSVLRIARLLRLTRMARMARLLRAMPELMILIKGMLAASRSVVFTLLLLLILMYVFAIAMTQLLAEAKHSKDEFRTVLQSMYTLWLHGTLLDDINWLQHKISKDSKLCTVIFFLFVLLASLTVMNMLIGVLCEVVSSVAAFEKEEMVVSFVKSKITDIVNKIDRDQSGKVNKEEFLKILEEREAVDALVEVGVDPVGLVDMSDFIFMDEEADEDGKEKELSLDDFLNMVLKLRGSNTATVKDVMDLRKCIAQTIRRVEDRMKRQHHRHASIFAASRATTRSMSGLPGVGGSPSPTFSKGNSFRNGNANAGDPTSPGGLAPRPLSPMPAGPMSPQAASTSLTDLLICHTGRLEAFIVATLHELQCLRDENLSDSQLAEPAADVCRNREVTGLQSTLQDTVWMEPEEADEGGWGPSTSLALPHPEPATRPLQTLTLKVSQDQLRELSARVEDLFQLILKAIHKMRATLPPQHQLSTTPRMKRNLSSTLTSSTTPSHASGARECLDIIVWTSRIEEHILLHGVDELEPMCDGLYVHPSASSARPTEVSHEALDELRSWIRQTETFLLASRNEAESMRNRLLNPGGRNAITLCEV